MSADGIKVTASEALPREEVAVTPYGVLCTTATGGHLGWFELGGGRWFAKVVRKCRLNLTLDDSVDWLTD